MESALLDPVIASPSVIFTATFNTIYRLGPLLLGSFFNAFLLGFVLIEGRAYFRSQNKYAPLDIFHAFSCTNLIPTCVRDRQWLKLLVRVNHQVSPISPELIVLVLDGL